MSHVNATAVGNPDLCGRRVAKGSRQCPSPERHQTRNAVSAPARAIKSLILSETPCEAWRESKDLSTSFPGKKEGRLFERSFDCAHFVRSAQDQGIF
jgi:hypothetical protein